MTALFGHMGMELDPASASDEQKKNLLNTSHSINGSGEWLIQVIW